MTGDQTPPAGWYPDKSADAPAGQQRYWDGSAWTERTTPSTAAPTESAPTESAPTVAAPTEPTVADYQPAAAYQAGIQQAPRNGLGTAALILGIIGAVSGVIPFMFWLAGTLGLIGLILGLIARGRVKRGEATNGKAALWGIITSAVALVLSVVGLVLLVAVLGTVAEDVSTTSTEPAPQPTQTATPEPEPEAAPPGAEEVDVFDLKVGDCVAEIQASEETFISVQTVPCSEPHSAEIISTATLPEGDFPGDEALQAQAGEMCLIEFESFVGLSYEESVLDFSFLYPHEGSWDAGDRFVVCAVYDPAGDTTGTLADANR